MVLKVYALFIIAFVPYIFCNEPPVFIHDMDGLKILESTQPGSVIYQIVGVDQESEVIYSLDGGDDTFMVDPILGTVTLLKKLDAKLRPRIRVRIQLQDLELDENPANTVTKTVTVFVLANKGKGAIGAEKKVAKSDNLQSSNAVNSPLFYPSTIAVTINENWPLHLPLPIKPKLTVIGPPAVTPLTLQLFVMPSDPSLKDAFTTDPLAIKGSGDFSILLKQNKFLDLEGKRSLGNKVNVEVEARDPTSGVSARLPVTIFIEDVNEHKPMFNREKYEFEAFENAEEGDLIGRIMATDLDFDYYGTKNLVFHVYGSNAKYFTLTNPTAGVAELKAHPCGTKDQRDNCVGWESLPDTISLLIRASDANGTGLWTDVPLEIKINRVNRFAPKFIRTQYETDILEETSEFNPVVQVEATDEDQDSKLMYRLDDATGLFGVDPDTGVLFVKHPEFITMENLGRRFNVTAFASDGSNPPAAVNITIRVMEHDEMNNVAPEFETGSYEFTVASGENFVGKVTAADPGDYFDYSIVQGGAGYFIVGGKTGVISYEGPKRVEDRVYLLQVMAMDSGSPPMLRNAEVKVTIKGMGSNDLEIVGDTVISKHIRQDAPSGTLLWQFKAKDLDEDADIQFTVAKLTAFTRNGMQLDPSLERELLEHIALGNDGNNNGSIYLRRDFTKSDILTMHIQLNVRDAAHDEEKIVTVHLLLSVEKVHIPSYDSQLEMLSLPDQISVPESLPVDSFVYSSARESAAAREARLNSDAPNKDIMFSLASGSEYFDIDHETGDIALKSSLDQVTSVPMVVRATHMGSGKSRQASSTVEVIQQNNHAPQFEEESYSITIPEDMENRVEVMRVSASDVDGDKLRFSLTGKYSDYFFIDQAGTIFTDRPLDREMESVLDFYVSAADKDSKTATVPVTVFVSDVNDNTPQFLEKAYSAEIMENIPLNSHMLQVQAMDKDHPDSTTALTYGLINVPAKLFPALLIDPSDGVVRNKANLNGLHGNYQFAAIAKDTGGKEVTVPIFLSIQSTTGCHPRITSPLGNDTHIVIREAQAPGVLLATVQAVTDSKECQISYVLWDEKTQTYVETNRDFMIHPKSGQLKTLHSFDREEQESYGIIVAAQSGAIYTQAFIVAEIEDINDNLPFFEPPRVYRFEIEENKPSYTALGSFKPTDSDTGINKKIYYYLMEAERSTDDEKWPVKAMFQVDQAGRLLTRRPLDREAKSMYKMWVVATNAAKLDPRIQNEIWDGAERTDAVFVEVEVVDVNDNGPVFEQQNYKVSVSANEPIGRNLVRVHAEDPDGSPDEEGGDTRRVYYKVNKVTFYSKGASAEFPNIMDVDESTGDVRVAGELKKFTDGYFLVDVESLDSRNLKVAMTDRARVKVWVHDDSDVVRLVVDERPEKVTRQQVDDIVKSVADTMKAEGLVKSVENHALESGKAASDKVDVLAVFVNKTDDTVIPVTAVLDHVDRMGIQGQNSNLEIQRVLPAAQASTSTSVNLNPMLSPAAIALIIFGCILILGLLAFLLLLCYFRYQFVQEKKAIDQYRSKPAAPQISKASNPVPLIFAPATPFTKENPLWDDKNTKPYEEKEMTLNLQDTRKAQKKPKTKNAAVDVENGYQTIERRL